MIQIGLGCVAIGVSTHLLMMKTLSSKIKNHIKTIPHQTSETSKATHHQP
jgi:hypothetical protein